MEDNTILIAAEPSVGCRSVDDETGPEPYESLSGILALHRQGTYQLVVAGLRPLNGRRYGTMVLHYEELPVERGISLELPEFCIRNAGRKGLPGWADSAWPLDRHRPHTGRCGIHKQMI